MMAEKEKQSNLCMHSHFHNSYGNHLHGKGAAKKAARGCSAPVLSGTLCQLEPRISNGLLIKHNHKSTQESSEAQAVSSGDDHRLYHSLTYTAQPSLPAVCWMVPPKAVVPETHQQGLEMSLWGLYLDPRIPGRGTYRVGRRVGCLSQR